MEIVGKSRQVEEDDVLNSVQKDWKNELCEIADTIHLEGMTKMLRFLAENDITVTGEEPEYPLYDKETKTFNRHEVSRLFGRYSSWVQSLKESALARTKLM
jgi:hypothetical protein